MVRDHVRSWFDRELTLVDRLAGAALFFAMGILAFALLAWGAFDERDWPAAVETAYDVGRVLIWIGIALAWWSQLRRWWRRWKNR